MSEATTTTPEGWTALKGWVDQKLTGDEHAPVREGLARMTKPKQQKRLLRYIETGKGKKWVEKKKSRSKLVNGLFRGALAVAAR